MTNWLTKCAWATLLCVVIVVTSDKFYLGDIRLGYPSFCICLQNHAGSSTTSVYKRDTLNTTVPRTAYRLYSVISNVMSPGRYCVEEADKLSLTLFPSLLSVDLNTTSITTQKDLLEALAISQFNVLPYDSACISYLHVYNVTV